MDTDPWRAVSTQHGKFMITLGLTGGRANRARHIRSG